ncbi:hypothetical protein B0T16DRAFT_444171 [Cercophora newfieldiana]|uniref:Cytochrome b561 domain-containing protein n=1 Tax=Cercophora newfieldiana TaxID=92897 RepID=A0AA39YIC5_9PEZI|nr:hypothetical protein B0T16DRAFT_444171 [Cercophora newfieldiana]
MASNIIFQDLPKVPSLATVHGTVMGLAFAIFMPLGAFLIRFLRVRNVVWVHTTCQLAGLALVLAGLASGIRLARIIGQLHNNAHTVLGTVVVAALLLQPFFGFIHHRLYLRTQKGSQWATLHVWYGRVLILLGIINGGLGLQLASGSPVYSKAGMIAYSVLAGLSGLSLLVIIVVSFFGAGTAAKQGVRSDPE